VPPRITIVSKMGWYVYEKANALSVGFKLGYCMSPQLWGYRRVKWSVKKSMSSKRIRERLNYMQKKSEGRKQDEVQICNRKSLSWT